MAALELPGGGPPSGPGPEVKPNPHQRRLMLAIAGGAVLALIFLLRSRGEPAQAPAQAVDPNALPQNWPSQSPQGSTFADNGEQAAQLGTAVSNALGAEQTSFDQQAQALQDLSAQIGTLAKKGKGDPAGKPGKGSGLPALPRKHPKGAGHFVLTESPGHKPGWTWQGAPKPRPKPKPRARGRHR